MRRHLLLLLGLPFFLHAQPRAHHRVERLMGCWFDLTVVADHEVEAERSLDVAVSEIRRIERLISSWDSTSQTAAINRAAGEAPVVVDRELFELITRANAISRLTDGAFDISYASVDHLWRFDGTMTEFPDSARVRSSVARVGYHRLRLDTAASSVYLPEGGMKIGFGAIGKGYAADRARVLLEANGVAAGIINASGDLTAWGRQPDGKDWLVAITNPLNRSRAFAWLPVSDGAVVTSGSYEKYATFGGVRYAHIIDPRTGYPSTGIVSATVFAPRAELADALATAVFVMGVDVGLHFINQLPGVEVVIVDQENKVHTTNGITLETPPTDD